MNETKYRILKRVLAASSVLLIIGFASVHFFGLSDNIYQHDPSAGKRSPHTGHAEGQSVQTNGEETSSDSDRLVAQTEKLRQEIELLFAPPATYGGALEAETFYEQWGRVDPLAAIDHIRDQAPNPNRDFMDLHARFLVAVFKGWASMDPDAAWVYTSTPREIPFTGNQLRLMQEHLLSQRLATGTRQSYRHVLELAKAEPSNRRAGLLKFTMRKIAARDPEYAVEMFNDPNSPIRVSEGNDKATETRDSFVSAIASAWAKSAPAAAADWAYAQKASPDRSLFAGIVQTWFETDPEAPFAWIDAHFEGDERDSLYQSSLARITFYRPDEVHEMIKTYFIERPETRSTDSQFIFRAIARNISPIDPALANQLLDIEPSRNGVQRAGGWYVQKASILVNWAMIDERSADAYLAALDTANDDDKKILAHYERAAQSSTPEELYSKIWLDWGTIDYEDSQANGVRFIDLYGSEPDSRRLNEQIEGLVTAWGAKAPERVRFYLEHQTALTPERTAELLNKLDNKQSSDPR